MDSHKEKKLYKTLYMYKYRVQDALFKVNKLSRPLSCVRFLDKFQYPFYNMFHLQITCLSYSN